MGSQWKSLEDLLCWLVISISLYSIFPSLNRVNLWFMVIKILVRLSGYVISSDIGVYMRNCNRTLTILKRSNIEKNIGKIVNVSKCMNIYLYSNQSWLYGVTIDNIYGYLYVLSTDIVTKYFSDCQTSRRNSSTEGGVWTADG